MLSISGEPWWYAMDICKVLDLKDVSMTVERVPDDEKLKWVLPTSGQDRQIWLLSEFGHDEKLRIARQSNNNAETIAKTPFVEDAEMIWEELKQEKMTQERLAEALGQGWSRGKISQYAMLEDISKQVWEIVATSFRDTCSSRSNNNVASDATNVAVFSEGLLRPILNLKPIRQYDLVWKLAALEWRDRKGTVSGIAPNIWTFIKEYEVPTDKNNGHKEEKKEGTYKVPTGTFSERLLRDIFSLKP